MSSINDHDSAVYGVDYNGKVWSLSAVHNSAGSWNTLRNPTNINLKRLVSFSGILWGIASDHQIYVYVPKQDIPIRVREEYYENQRWNPVEGFCSHLLPTDRAPFSSEDGVEPRDKDPRVPSESWQWEGEWQIENTFENQIVAEGWTYAVDFPATYHPEKSWKSCVRRRKLYRYRRYMFMNRWNMIDPLHDDHTKEPFIDVGIGGLNPISDRDTCCMWAVSILGEVYFRVGTTLWNPEGTNWELIPIRKGLEACQVSVSRNGIPFVVTWTGSFMFRIGITPKNLQGTHWLESSGPNGGLLQLSVGFNSLWAITRDKKCWALKGNSWQEIVVQTEPLFEWIEIPGRMKSISLGKSDNVILALSDDEISSLFQRIGVSDDQQHGQCWKPAFPDIPWDSVSISTVDEIDGSAGDSAESLVSLRPDIPLTTNFGPPIENSSPNSLCWIDGSCVSSIRSTADGDLEVGPWRDDILQDLQKLKMHRKDFEKFPDAIEPSTSSWSSKSSKVKFLHKSRSKSKWIAGQLEISNNNHLVFHENLTKSWLCAMSDILSVFAGASGSNTVTCRIRNSIEPGVADFVSFKFANESDAEEWKFAISELSKRPSDDFSIANIWLTTSEGEIHSAGQVKILDAPTETEVIATVPGSDLKLHHPMVQGFLPGSEINIDISIPKGASRFAINLKGKDDTIPFHFNPRMADGHVIRNSFQNDEWGIEEKDGVFPFRDGHCYALQIQSTQTHIMTTVTEKKHKFIFSYKHRIASKCICNLLIYGDVDVTSVRYDPKFGEDCFELEFASENIAGHFWKVEAGTNGAVWALGYDLKVWCYTGTRNSKPDTGTIMTEITDEQTFYIYENQRWNPLTGFGSHGLPTDRQNWTDETGRVNMDKDQVRLLSKQWCWITEWEVDYSTPNGVDEEGWQYAVDFPAQYHPSKRLNDFVRRRRWKKISQFSVPGPWKCVTNMKLVDLSIRMNEDCDMEVLGLTEKGDAVFRSGITPECCIGTSWESLSTEKPLISISGWYNQRIWAIGKDGFAYIRYGNAWQMLDRPRDTPLRNVTVGPSTVWAVGINHVLYRRSEIQPMFPEGRTWIKVCDDVIQACLSPDGSVWGLLKTKDTFKCTLGKRVGITQNTPGGLGWELIAAGPWAWCTLAGAFSRNK